MKMVNKNSNPKNKQTPSDTGRKQRSNPNVVNKQDRFIVHDDINEAQTIMQRNATPPMPDTDATKKY